MNKSTIEAGQPEQQPNSGQTADIIPSAQVSANAVLAEVPGGLNSLSKKIFLKNKEKWNYPDNRNIGEVLCLLHSEISEALEADRKEMYCPVNIKGVLGWGNQESFLAHYEETVKGTFEEEMADIFIRLLDLCGNKSIDIENHVKAKLKYNFTSNNTYGKKY